MRSLARDAAAALISVAVPLAACTDSTEDGDGSDGGAGGGPAAVSATSANGGPQTSGATTSSGPSTTGSGGGTNAFNAVIAQGHVGRTMLSCDDGLSWVHDRSDDPSLRCEGGVDCDHHPGSGTGLVSSSGFAVMSSGWGTPGRVRRSNDGASWEDVLDLDFPFASLAEGQGTLLGATPRPMESSDGGATWTDVNEIYLAPPLRGSMHIPHGGGRFVLTSEGDGLRVWLTDDLGASFHESAPLPEGCIAFSLRFGNGVLVMPAQNGGVCRSTDGGETWTQSTIDAGVGMSTLAFIGGRFVAFGDGVLYESPDAASWSSTPADLPAQAWNTLFGPGSASGTFLAVSGAYEDQRWFRSDDGSSWTEITSAPKGHPIRRLVPVTLAAPACD